MELAGLLNSTFGFPAFRANQEAVCRAATEGRDVLLVMPTGAGKSLCYQLPTIARGGTGLVISPLIALMDDQAAKLSAAGLRVARIHSGLSREDSRQACRDYLDGKLQFLFIAPERMRVPGFPEMLARRKPSLVAIDEAHCISAWGHDFRPDYRTLGDFLPSLRPAPVIALTATATPTVQKDIVAQLHLDRPALFIHGFRRENLAIEVVELSKPRRTAFIANFLKEPARRPAIVYAPSRRIAEELAGELGRAFPAAAYHAGLEASVRERVQRHFQTGKLEVVVATIAFGMGIDKADVRTVMHAAMPASVEAYYQEIGRAGRDGLPSRTVLLYSFADRKMHDFFLEQDYPPATDLTRIWHALTDDFLMPDVLARKLKMDRDVFAKGVEKLAAQGAAQIDLADNVRRGEGGRAWQTGYEGQVAFRRSQIDRMMQFAETAQCRMGALIRHFGDTADSHKPCGHCDFCAPEATTAQTFAEPTASDERTMRNILRALDGASRSTGKLHAETGGTSDRKAFDALLDGLARAGLIELISDTFTTQDGREIAYKKAALTYEGQTLAPGAPLGVVLRAIHEGSAGAKAKPATKRRGTKAEEAPLSAEEKELEERLRGWRKAEAAKTGKPAFIVFGDTCLGELVRARPATISALLEVPGIGPDKADRYGAAICAICKGADVPGEFGLPVTSVPTRKTSAARSAREVSSPRSSKRTGARAPQAAHVRPSAPAYPRMPTAAEAGPLLLEESGSDPTVRSAKPAPERVIVPDGDSRPRPDAFGSLTPEQLALEQKLRDWRRSESERMGLPQFFVLGATALRGIVLSRPRTLSELGGIYGVGDEKLNRFGTSILELCKP